MPAAPRPVRRGTIVSTAPKANLSYEEAYKRLEEAVAELSAGGLSLEEALRRFEQGIALANYCSTLLDQAELRVQQVGHLAPDDLTALLEGGPAPAGGAPGGAAGGAGPALTPAGGPLAGPA